MPGQRITCTECDASLTVSETVGPGKKIRCPKCQAIFRVPEPADQAVAEGEAHKRPRASDADERDRDDDYDSRPVRRREREREKSGMGVGMVIGIIAASLLLIAGVGFGVWWGVSSWNESQDAEQKAKMEALAAKVPQTIPNNQGPNFNPLNQGKGLPLFPNPAAAGPQVGQKAPEIEGEDIDGQKFKLSDYRGKVVLLDFWGHW